MTSPPIRTSRLPSARRRAANVSNPEGLTYPLPQDTQAIIRNFREQCLNVGLWLDKFVGYEDSGTKWSVSSHSKQRGGVSMDLGNLKGLITSQRERWSWLCNERECPGKLPLYTITRLVVGLGGESVLETAITLHPIYGLPIVPGSALKGLTRFYALMVLAQAMGVPMLTHEAYWQIKVQDTRAKTPLGQLEMLLSLGLEIMTDAERAVLEQKLGGLQQACPGSSIAGLNLVEFAAREDVRRFRAVFGWQGSAGQAVFMDGIPSEVPAFALDVMTPHYSDYYGGAIAPPSDNQKVKPINFLVVSEGAPFYFAVTPRNKGNAAHKQAAVQATKWLNKALREVGVGAKTSAGYGLFGGEMSDVGYGTGDDERAIPQASDRTPGLVALPVEVVEGDVSDAAPEPRVSPPPSDLAEAVAKALKNPTAPGNGDVVMAEVIAQDGNGFFCQLESGHEGVLIRKNAIGAIGKGSRVRVRIKKGNIGQFMLSMRDVQQP